MNNYRFRNLGRGFDASKMHLSPLVAWAVTRSKVVILLLLIYCLLCLPLFVGVQCWTLFWYSIFCVHFSFTIILARKREG